MQRYNKVVSALRGYKPEPSDLLEYLNAIYNRWLKWQYMRDIYEEDDEYQELAWWGADEFLFRDEDGFILVKQSIYYGKCDLENMFMMAQAHPFCRTMERTSALKEELMAAVWHPRRIERLLDIGGESALDNFAGL